MPSRSEKLIRSHYDNNYIGAAKRLGTIEADFAKLDMATASSFLVKGPKREELLAWNSDPARVHFEGFGKRDAPSAQLGSGLS